MRIEAKLWFSFCVVWFGLKGLDYLMPPGNLVFNAALTIAGMMVVLGQHFDGRLKS